jgi:hypothetical protein
MTKKKNDAPQRNSDPIEVWKDRITAAWQKGVASIVETGKLLVEAKAQVDHGEWTRLIENELPFDRTTALRLMTIAQHPIVSNDAHGQHLPTSWRTLYELTKMDQKLLSEKLESGEINAKTERKSVVAMRPRPKPTQRKKQRTEIGVVTINEKLYKEAIGLAISGALTELEFQDKILTIEAGIKRLTSMKITLTNLMERKLKETDNVVELGARRGGRDSPASEQTGSGGEDQQPHPDRHTDDAPRPRKGNGARRKGSETLPSS